MHTMLTAVEDTGVRYSYSNNGPPPGCSVLLYSALCEDESRGRGQVESGASSRIASGRLSRAELVSLPQLTHIRAVTTLYMIT